MNKTTLTALTLFGVSATSLLVTNSAQAAIFNLTYTDTVSFNNNGVDNVNLGDSAVITYQLDNGGTSLLNQTWTASDIVSVTFDFGNGSHTTTFDPNGGDGLTSSTGSFVTDGLGQLTAVPSAWTDNSQVNVISTNSAQTPSGFGIDGNNPVYATNGFISSIFLTNVSGTTDPANWTVAPADTPSTPEPSTLLGLLVMGGAGLLTKCKKQN
ncbi:MAG: PEP-CTERM sorting domain-containing protein [Microcystaceae cyanobacterium]